MLIFKNKLYCLLALCIFSFPIKSVASCEVETFNDNVQKKVFGSKVLKGLEWIAFKNPLVSTESPLHSFHETNKNRTKGGKNKVSIYGIITKGQYAGRLIAYQVVGTKSDSITDDFPIDRFGVRLIKISKLESILIDDFNHEKNQRKLIDQRHDSEPRFHQTRGLGQYSHLTESAASWAGIADQRVDAAKSNLKLKFEYPVVFILKQGPQKIRASISSLEFRFTYADNSLIGLDHFSGSFQMKVTIPAIDQSSVPDALRTFVETTPKEEFRRIPVYQFPELAELSNIPKSKLVDLKKKKSK